MTISDRAMERVVVIGTGESGLRAAVACARSGCETVLIGDTELGGRAVHQSLLPSKFFRRYAQLYRDAGLNKSEHRALLQSMRTNLQAAQEHYGQRWRRNIEAHGIDWRRGVAQIYDSNTVELKRANKDTVRISCDQIFLASGSMPNTLGDKPLADFDGKPWLLPRHIGALEKLPNSLLVIGGGVSGAEFASAFSLFGIEVTWLIDEDGVLPQAPRGAANTFGDALMERGVKIVHGKSTKTLDVGADGFAHAQLDGGRTYAAEQGLLCVGRVPDLRVFETNELADKPTQLLESWLAHGTNLPVRLGDARGEVGVASRAVWEAEQIYSALQGRQPAPAKPFVIAIHADPEVAFFDAQHFSANNAALHTAVKLIDVHLGDTFSGLLEFAGLHKQAAGHARVAHDSGSNVVHAYAIGPRATDLISSLAVKTGGAVPATPSIADWLADM